MDLALQERCDNWWEDVECDCPARDLRYGFETFGVDELDIMGGWGVAVKVGFDGGGGVFEDGGVVDDVAVDVWYIVIVGKLALG